MNGSNIFNNNLKEVKKWGGKENQSMLFQMTKAHGLTKNLMQKGHLQFTKHKLKQ